ncbi:acetyl-CoA hydrolase/transferase family protein [Noviherbaspirillum sedimenti]|uniref:Acetyl-CoA hydrolase/transferase C-terminal domain-containing protein n=1 Tax=Noviherbaspirillum sedimenti TaxID=2320865 RepID=A0A3A3GQN2_9BURK|nr:acetyl-CoA hydrolase/transferase C-terminal domain-containing protein [Noviherbaspirillum sedimenti]RJG03290.1 hypothetical protein D3878_18250 [Noviherbaspirillum sedimenti]
MKDLTGNGLVDAIGPAREIYVSGCSAEIVGLPELLGNSLPGATVTGILSPLLNTRSYASPVSGRRCRTFFLNKEIKQHLSAGLVDLCPWTYSQISNWLRNTINFDAAVVMVSPPDDQGRVSLGVQCDFLPLFRGRVKRLIGVVNPKMPYTFGDTTIPLDAFSAVFGLEHDLLSPPAPKAAEANPSIETIGRAIADLIPDGATIQLGIGKIPQAVSRRLTEHRNIGVISGLVDDDILYMEDQGVLDRSKPIVTGVAIGSSELYAQVHKNPRFSFQPCSRTHKLEALIGVDRFYSVNATLQIDLFGQINSEMIDGRFISVPGGFPDFLRGASMNPTGRAIVALQASAGKSTSPGIVFSLSTPASVTATKTEVDLIVTEFGVAQLKNLSMDQRAEALIAIAAPEDRDALQAEWSAFRGGAFGPSSRRPAQASEGRRG